MDSPDHPIGSLVTLRHKISSVDDSTFYIVIEKKMPLPWNKGRPFYYVYNKNTGKIGPCFHDELRIVGKNISEEGA